MSTEDDREVPADTPVSEIQADGIWRPEPWKDERYLISRYVETETKKVEREVHSTSKFSSFAHIFETLEAAEAESAKLNKAEAKEKKK